MPDLYSNEPDTLPTGVHASQACPPLALLRAWKEDVLTADLARDVASHAENCTLCSTLISDLEHLPQPGITAAERARIRQKLPLIAPTARTGGWRWYTVAGAAAALIIAGVLLTISQTEHPRQAHIDVPTVSEPAQTQAVAPQPAAPSAEPQLAKLEPPVDLSPALVLRGEVTTSEPTAQQLAPAFDAYSRNDYQLAAQRFSQLAKQFPRSGTPFLYLGVTQLLTNDNANALFNLTRAEQFISPGQKDVASWYRAIAARRTNAPNASQLLHAICSRNGSPYAQQACQLEQMQSSN
jgi:hypothetical protein